MAEHAWSGLRPSRAHVVDAGNRRPDANHHQGSSLRGIHQWTPNAGSDESWGGGTAPNLGPPSSGMQAVAAPGEVMQRLVPERARAASGGIPGFLQHRQGWKRLSSPTSGGFEPQRAGYRFDSSPCSELKLDEEMTMFESLITRTVSDHFSNLSSRSSSLSQEIAAEISSIVKESTLVVAEAGEKLKSSEVDGLKRKISRLPDTDVQGDRGWMQPLKLLVRKGLTVSDVGELGRIIIPKKDAENQSFPQIDTKEGTVLELEDYTASKRWYFRFKYWINNKSRMYVLENTGEFIKFHNLKEHDMFIVYEDRCKKLVVCAQKKSLSGNLDPLNEVSKLEMCASETPPTITPKDESRSCTTNIDISVAAHS